MRSNIVTESGLTTKIGQWWEGIPFLTSAIVIVCGLIYLVCLLSGYDSFVEICFLPSSVVLRFQVYRIFTSVVFHGSLVHVMFNMLALVPLGSELERIMGSVRLLYVIILLATSNAFLHVLIAFVVAHNPLHSYDHFMNECAIGFSGILFSMIVIETSLSGAQSRSVFGLFNLPAKWYPWLLLIVFQLLMPNVSLLGHLCGILTGFAYTYGIFNYLLPGSSFYSSIEGTSFLSTCVRRPKFIMCTGGIPTGYIPTHSNQNTTSSTLFSSDTLRYLSSWMPQRDPQREASSEAVQDHRFPGRGRTLAPASNSDSNLQARLLDNSSPDWETTALRAGNPISDGRLSAVDSNLAAAAAQTLLQEPNSFDEEIQMLVGMGFEKTQVEVAIAAADGDTNVAVEILMTQQG